MSFFLNLNAAQILLIAHDPELSDFLNEIIADAGYNVQKAHTFDDAKFMANYKSFDLAVVETNAIKHDRASFETVISNGLLFGRCPWIVIGESEANADVADRAHGFVNLLESGYSPKIVLSTIAQTLDQTTDLKKDVDETDTDSGDLASEPNETRRLFERKLLEHQTLSSIARMLNSTLELTTVLRKVVEAATSLTNAEEGLLLLPDDDGRSLYIRAAKGIDSDTAKEFRIKTDDTLAGQVFKTGNPVLVGDSGWQKVKTEYFVKSLLYVPMTFKDEVIGVLGVNNRNNDQTFNAHDRDLLLDLASHAAIAIENARLYGESVQRSKELAMLFSAGQAVNSTLSLEGVLSIITDRLVDALGISMCDIATYDPDKKTLHITISRQRAQWQLKQMARKSKPPTSLYEAVTRRQRVYLAQQTAKDETDLQYLSSRHADLLCVFPLATENRVIGAFELVYTKAPSKRSTGVSTLHIHQHALHLMMVVDAVTLHNAETEAIAQNLLDETGADFCTLYLWDENLEQVYRRWSFGKAVWQQGNAPVLSLNEYSTLKPVATDRVPVVFNRHDQSNPEIAKLLDQYGARTLLVMPMIIANEVAGFVFMADTIRQKNFNSRQIEIASALILQAANALKNARLFVDLQQSLQDLREAQTRLIQAARLSAMGELAAAVAHQINNPLTTVIGDTELILQDLEPNHRDYESIIAVHRAGKRAHEVVRRLLGMAHQGHEDDPAQLLDINATIRNTLTLVGKHIEQQNVDIKVRLSDELPQAYGIPGQLEDVWMNLLLNARDAVAARSAPQIGIQSHLSKDGNWIEVEVWDNGTGIPTHLQKEIFEAFVTTKPAGEGTGLGLHICRQVVRKSNGDLLIKHSDETGTVFLVRLPTP